MLEKTLAAIKNGQSRDTSNTGHTTDRTKTNKTKYKQLRVKMNRTSFFLGSHNGLHNIELG